MPSNPKTTASEVATSSVEHASASLPTGEYTVGYGRPPKEFQFKPGQSGNPKGLKRMGQPLATYLKGLMERAPQKASLN